MVATKEDVNRWLNIPGNVKAQGDKAEQLTGEVASATPVEVVNPPQQTAPPKPEEPPKKEEPVAVEPQPEPPAKEPQETPPPQDQTWEHRYNVLKGKYDTEMGSLRQELKANQETVSRLLRMLEQKGTQGQPGGEPVTPEGEGQGITPARRETRLNPEDFEGYGEEMKDMVNLVNSLIDENAELKGEISTVDQRVSTKTQTDFFGELDRLTGGRWRQLNDDPVFLDWLGKSDSPRDHQTRHEKLDYVVKVKPDPAKAAQFFLDFEKEMGAANPPAGKEPQQGLEGQVVPAQEVSTETQRKDLGFTVVTTQQFNDAVKLRIQGNITDEEFNRISDNYQRTLAAAKAGKISL
jgi:hypothetical protein